MLQVNIGFGAQEIGTLQITRSAHLQPRKDTYKYTARYVVPDMDPFTVTFKARYSQGCLSLISCAFKHLVARYPVLGMPRPDKAPNKVRCRKCRTTLWSRHRHEYVACKCNAIAVDGGYDYQRLIGELEDVEFTGDKEYARKKDASKKACKNA